MRARLEIITRPEHRRRWKIEFGAPPDKPISAGADNAAPPACEIVPIASRIADAAKPWLPHVCNMHSQILSGASLGPGLRAPPSLQFVGVLHVSRKFSCLEVARN